MPIAFPCKKALITGASSGLGAEFARQLADRGVAVVLVARSSDKLESLAEGIHSRGGQAQVITCDLQQHSERKRLKKLFEMPAGSQPGAGIDLLVNNAGFGKVGNFHELSLDDNLGQVELNVAAVVELSHYAAKAFASRRRGAIINIASTASFNPIPLFATYAATKSFVRDFSEALREELLPYHVRVAVVCPGPTDTAFFQVAGDAGFIDNNPMPVHQVVSDVLKAFEAGENVIVPGALNKAHSLAANLIPRRLSMLLAREFMAGDKGKVASLLKRVRHGR